MRFALMRPTPTGHYGYMVVSYDWLVIFLVSSSVLLPSVLLNDVGYSVEFILNVLKGGYLLYRLFQIEPPGVVGVEFFDGGAFGVAFFEEFVVVEVAVVGRDAVEVAHVFGLGAFFFGEEGFVHLLAVADADDFDLGKRFRVKPGMRGLVLEEVSDGFGLGLDGAGGGFLDEDVAILPVFEGEEDKVHGLLEAHDEAGHPGLGEGDGVALADLVDPQRNHAAAAAHDVAVAGAADLGAAAEAALGHGYLLLDGLGDAHGVDGIGGFVGGEADDALHARVDGGIEGVVRADDVGLDGFHGEELAAGHLLEGRGVEHVIDPLHGVLEGALVAHIANVELDLPRHLRHPRLEVVPHIVLLLLIP